MSSTVKLAEYLFTRLKQLGVGSIHGVPGDFNLELLDYVEPSGLHWVGNANELNAGYAADGYARIKGVGAIITTFGVGELSAINAIAGAYAERAAVVHIVGTPARASQEAGLKIHHTFNDGNFRRFGQMYAHVTVSQTSLRDPRTSPEQIDQVLRQCLLHSRPVYIEVPVDLVAAPVPADGLREKLQLADSVPTPALETAVSQILDKIHAAKQPIILVDGETRALGIVDQVQRLTRATNWPTWTTAFGKGLLDESAPNFQGVYGGAFDAPATRSFFQHGADLVLCFGPHFSSTNTSNYTGIPPAGRTISFADARITLPGDSALTIRDVPLALALDRLVAALAAAAAAPAQHDAYPALARAAAPESFAAVAKDEPIAHAHLWRLLAASLLRPGDIVLGETGTSGHGVREMTLPPHARLFAPVTWLSIGYMLPAALGAAIAQRELVADGRWKGVDGEGRVVLFIGDGSLQMTVQELGTMVKEGVNVLVVVVDNSGYTIERCIHGLREGYNDVGRWRYGRAPGLFGADEEKAVVADERVVKGSGLRFLELEMRWDDAPKGVLSAMMEKEKKRVGWSA
ncbi:thiamine pyrophosphate enzyme [Macrophomina phaseolina]|uniref:Pyruvate decarboxylase n=1 Tax=Macrophomina phaseolina TaxID=35725 RepID=A0ABQ8G6S3_9PEZI|nr:thiamine pyrophosphate enzyme [Macrophomina phaseolina]